MTIEETVKLILLSIFNVLFIGIFSYVFIDALIHPSQVFAIMNPWIVLLLSLIVLVILYGVYHTLSQLSKKSLIIFSCFNFLVLIGLQIFFLRYFQVEPAWDVGGVYHSALSVKDGFTVFPEYFTDKYPNNIPLFLVELLGMKLLSLLHIENYYYVFTFANALVMTLTMGCFYWFIKRRLGLVAATWGSFFMLFITPLYTYTTIFYTDTTVMIFMIFGVLLYDLFYHSKDRSHYTWLLLMSVVLAIGVLLKANVIILLVAILIHFVMTNSYKSWLGFFTGSLLPFFMLTILYQQWITPYYPVEKAEIGYPMTHWIMMGSEGRGTYSATDDEFTNDLKLNQELSNEQIKEVHLEIIKDRLTKNGFSGLMNHLKEKINFTWAEGTYFAPEKLSRLPVSENVYQPYIWGDAKVYFVYFCQAVQLVILGLIVVGGIKLFQQKSAFEIVLSIAIFGTFLFLLIWETRSRYLIVALPLIMALCVYGIASNEKSLN